MFALKGRSGWAFCYDHYSFIDLVYSSCTHALLFVIDLVYGTLVLLTRGFGELMKNISRQLYAAQLSALVGFNPHLCVSHH